MSFQRLLDVADISQFDGETLTRERRIVQASREVAERFVLYLFLERKLVTNRQVARKLYKYVVGFQQESVAPKDIALFAESFGLGIDEACDKYMGLEPQEALAVIREKDYIGKQSAGKKVKMFQEVVTINEKEYVATFESHEAKAHYPELQSFYPCQYCGCERDIDQMLLTVHGPICREHREEN